ncbi:MAG: DTW domain-containing protein [Gammaproteobacteria bacterium]|nr:DTW domain-containing protein [Gammaproteobacteria bacterium]
MVDKTSRHICRECQLPDLVCVCGIVEKINAPLTPIILQHPTESNHSKNTARLINLVISNSNIYVGETADDFSEVIDKLNSKRVLLLYPSNNASVVIEECLNCRDGQSNSQVQNIDTSVNSILSYLNCSEQCSRQVCYQNTLSQFDSVLLIDASWRKAKKIFHKNPWLHHLPHGQINLTGSSQYLIRKHSNESSLSTLEALMVLYKVINAPCYQNLNDIFNHFKLRKLASMPEHIRLKYLEVE